MKKGFLKKFLISALVVLLGMFLVMAGLYVGLTFKIMTLSYCVIGIGSFTLALGYCLYIKARREMTSSKNSEIEEQVEISEEIEKVPTKNNTKENNLSKNDECIRKDNKIKKNLKK